MIAARRRILSAYSLFAQQRQPATRRPALTLPMGFSTERLPIGLQIAGNRFDEEWICPLAAAYEEGPGWCEHRPAL